MAEDTRADAELVHAARAGDVAALGALLERHRAALYATAITVLGDPTDARDVVQDTVLTALARLDQLRDPAAVAGWLHTVARNHSLMRLRAKRELPAADPTRTRPAHFMSKRRSSSSPSQTGCGPRSTAFPKTKPSR